MDFYSQTVPVLRTRSHLLKAQLMAECGGSLKHDLHKVLYASIKLVGAPGSIPPTIVRRAFKRKQICAIRAM